MSNSPSKWTGVALWTFAVVMGVLAALFLAMYVNAQSQTAGADCGTLRAATPTEAAE
jgi:hypothetical protein